MLTAKKLEVLNYVIKPMNLEDFMTKVNKAFK